jgi:hypothetical protein
MYVDNTYSLPFVTLYKLIVADPRREEVTKELAIAFTQIVNKDSVTACLEDAYVIADKGSPYFKIISKLKERLGKGVDFYQFSLPDTSGNIHTLNEYKGRTIILDFWFTGCFGCAQLANAIKPVKEYFKDNPNVVFISISIDKDLNLWKRSVISHKYNEETDVNLYTGGWGNAADIIKYYKFNGYPRLFILDNEGRVFDGAPERPAGKTITQIFINTIIRSVNKTSTRDVGISQ